MINVIDFLRYVLLGILQGFTEPLPISSSGHLVLMKTLMNMPTLDYFLEIVLHFASLIAIILLFRKRITRLIVGNFHYVFKRDKAYAADARYALLIVIGVIPAGLAGLLFRSFFEGLLTVVTVGISLIVTGSFLMLVQRQSVENTKTELTMLDALSIGAAQVVALLPGISRSGATYVGGLIRRVKFEAVVEFSFMLYIPISVATMLLAARDVNSFSTQPTTALVAAFIAGVFATYFAFKWFVHTVKQGNLKYFAYYCFAVGALTLVVSLLT